MYLCNGAILPDEKQNSKIIIKIDGGNGARAKQVTYYESNWLKNM